MTITSIDPMTSIQTTATPDSGMLSQTIQKENLPVFLASFACSLPCFRDSKFNYFNWNAI